MLEFVKISADFSIEGFYSAIKFDWNDKFVFSGESHNFWEAVYVESGEVEVTEDENVYTLGEGNLILHAPNEFHRIKSAGGSSPKGFIMSFVASGTLPQSLMGGVFTLEPSQSKKYLDICHKIHVFYHNDHSSASGQEVGALLTAFLINLGTKTARNQASMTQSAIEYRRLVSFMTENVCENLTLDDIARRSNLSVSYLKLLFKNYAGISPKSYFNQLRIRRATEMLESGIPSGAVSEMMNFSSPNYFSVFYKNHTGISPSEKQRDTQ